MPISVKKKVFVSVSLVVVILIAFVAGYIISMQIENATAEPVKILEPRVITLNDSGEDNKLTMFFAGDTFLGDAGEKILKKKGFDYSFEEVKELSLPADIAIANMESPIAVNSKKQPMPKGYKYKMSPDAIPALKNAGLDLVLLANNHITDYCHEGLYETLDFLKEASITIMGAGRNESEARQGLIVKKDGISIGILDYMAYRSKYDTLYKHYAKGERGGVANLNRKNLKQDIKMLKKSGADTIIVTVHWRRNYKKVTKKQKKEARYIIKEGADIVIGHGNHDYQGMEFVKNKPVFYCIGNFAFTTPGRKSFKYGFPLTMTFNKDGIEKIVLNPIITQNRISKYKPRVLKGKKAEEALEEFKQKSKFKKHYLEITDGRGEIKF